MCKDPVNPEIIAVPDYSEDWNEHQQEEDEWQVPDKFQKISDGVSQRSPRVSVLIFIDNLYL